MKEVESGAEITRFPYRATEQGRHSTLGEKLHDTVQKAVHEAFEEAIQAGLPKDEAVSLILVAVENYLEDKIEE